MAGTINIREEALDALMEIEKKEEQVSHAAEDALLRLQFQEKKERALFTRLTEGTTERRITLDYVLDAYAKTPMRKCRPLIRNLLRLSAYQILFMDVQDFAAVSEAVKLAKKRGFGRLSGFVNGVLRTLIREREQIRLPDRAADPAAYLSVAYSMPPWLTALFLEQYGAERAERMLSAFLEARPLSARCNISKIAPEALAKRLLREGVETAPGHYLPCAFQIQKMDYLGRIPSFREGMFCVQDESSMLPALAAGLRPGDTVIDVCAAPGGKTLHAADLVGETGRVLARDISGQKTEKIEENLRRCGFSNVTVEVWDAAVPDADRFGTADVVFADLPCSGLGVLGRKNDSKYRLRPEQLPQLVTLQRKILSASWQYVKPGGTLLYSTCTVNRAENEENVRWITEHTPLHPVSIENFLPEALRGRTGEQGMLQLLPGIDAADGFFLARFARPGEV